MDNRGIFSVLYTHMQNGLTGTKTIHSQIKSSKSAYNSGETLEVRWISGNLVCESMPLSDAPWTNPLDVLQFKSFANDILARASITDISGSAHSIGTLPIVLEAKHVYNDNGVQLDDTERCKHVYNVNGVSCQTRLTVSTIKKYDSLRDAAVIEKCLRASEFPDAISLSQSFKKCQRDSRDLIVVMAWEYDREIFMANVQLIYEDFGGLDDSVRACLLRAYHKKWPKKFQGPRARRPARGGPKTEARSASQGNPSN